MAAVADHYFFDFFERAGIHQHASGGDRLAPVRAAIGGEFDGLAAFQQENLAADGAELLGQRGVAEELAVFAVNRDEIFRAHQLQQDFHFFLAGVAGDVDRSGAPAFVIDQHAAAEEMINHAEDGFFVAGNDARGKNYGVVFGDAQQAMIVHRDARESGHRLGLRAAGQHDQFLRIEGANVLRAHHAAIGNAQFAEAVRDFDVVHHAAADEADFAADHAGDINRPAGRGARSWRSRRRELCAGAARINSSRRTTTARSDGVKPGRSTLVLSLNSASTPSCP